MNTNFYIQQTDPNTNYPIIGVDSRKSQNKFTSQRVFSIFLTNIYFLNYRDQIHIASVSKETNLAVNEAYKIFNWMYHTIKNIQDWDSCNHPCNQPISLKNYIFEYIRTYWWRTENIKLSSNHTLMMGMFEEVLKKKLPLIRSLEQSCFLSLSLALKATPNEILLEKLTLQFLQKCKTYPCRRETQILKTIAEKCTSLKYLSIDGIAGFEDYEGLSDVFNLRSFSSFHFTAFNSKQLKKLNSELIPNVPLHTLAIRYRYTDEPYNELFSEEDPEEILLDILSKITSLQKLEINHPQMDVFTDRTFLKVAEKCKNLKIIDLSDGMCSLNTLTTLTRNCQQLTHLRYDKFVNTLILDAPGPNQEWYKYCPQLASLKLFVKYPWTLRSLADQLRNKEPSKYDEFYISKMISHLPNLTYLALTTRILVATISEIKCFNLIYMSNIHLKEKVILNEQTDSIGTQLEATAENVLEKISYGEGLSKYKFYN